jgi:hypothetical protein
MLLGFLRSKEPTLSYSLKKLKNFYLTYWLYFLVFVPIGLFLFPKETIWHSTQIRYSAEPMHLIQGLLGWNYSYNSEWWFIRPFILILLFFFPLYAKLIDKNISVILFISISIVLLCRRFQDNVDNIDSVIGETAFLQISFALGMVCAKWKFFSSQLIENFDKLGWIWVAAWLGLCYLLKALGFFYDFLIVPFFVYFSIRAIAILRLSKLFAFLGKYSFGMWLVHSFFCYCYFQDFIYAPKWAPLIFSLLTVVSLLSVLGIESLRAYCSALWMSSKRLRQAD